MLASAGKAANVPVIYGFNADEGTVFNTCPTDLPTSEYFTFLNETCVVLLPQRLNLMDSCCFTWRCLCCDRYGTALAQEVMQEYPASNFSSVYWATSRALGDSQVRCAGSTVESKLSCGLI